MDNTLFANALLAWVLIVALSIVEQTSNLLGIVTKVPT